MTSTDNIEQTINALLLAAAVAILVMIALIIWATILLFQVQAGLERLYRSLNPTIQRDGNGRRIKERI